MFSRRVLLLALGGLALVTVTVAVEGANRESMGKVEGIAYNMFGEPVAGALIRVIDGSGKSFDLQTTRTGSFTFAAREGTYKLLGGLKSFPTGVAEARVRGGETTFVSIKLQERP